MLYIYVWYGAFIPHLQTSSCAEKFHSFTYVLHIQEGDVVVVVELRVEAADGAILARDREQPVERIREEHVVKAEVL